MPVHPPSVVVSTIAAPVAAAAARPCDVRVLLLHAHGLLFSSIGSAPADLWRFYGDLSTSVPCEPIRDPLA